MSSVLQRERPAYARVVWIARNHGTLIGVCIGMLILNVIVPGFASARNWILILKESSPVAILGTAQVLVLIVQGIDLSLGPMSSFGGFLCGVFLTRGGALIPSILATLGVAAGVGLANAGVMAGLGVRAIVGTLGTMLMLTSGSWLLSGGGHPLYLFTMRQPAVKSLLSIGKLSLGPIPFSVVVMILVTLVASFVMRNTALGRWFYAIGESPSESRRAGLRVRYLFGAPYVIGALLAAVAGMMLVSTSGVASPGGGLDLLLDALTVSFISMTLLGRGKMNVEGVLVGAIFLKALSNALILSGADPWVTQLAKGCILLGAMSLGYASKRARST